MRAARVLFVAASLLVCSAQAADPSAGILGKDGWLYFRYENADAAAAPDIARSVRLIGRISRVLARNDVTLVMALIPVKMRVYAEHLPGDFKLTPYMSGQYDQIAKALDAEGVPVIDIGKAFASNPKTDGTPPLFFRLDSHWTPTGAMAAAEAIRSGLQSDPALKRAFDATPEEKYSIRWDEKPGISLFNDLVPQLPPGTPAQPPESYMGLAAVREKALAASLIGDEITPAITLMGSSYSADWTTFPAALRYALQRDVLSHSIPANQGSWVGFESYLRDESFQLHRPKIIVWEMPERDMRAPPAHKYREARYSMDDNEWLLRAAAWIESACAPASASVKSLGGALGATAAPAKEGEFVEVAFDRPLDRLEYVSARLLSYGATRVRLEPSGPGAPAKPTTVIVPGDDEPHAFRTPLYSSSGKGFDKVRFYPGIARQFAIQDVRVCRQSENLLK